MKELKDWVEFTKKYPPAEIFYQQSKEKQEKRCQEACSRLFSLNADSVNHPAAKMRAMWACWREFEVLIKLGHRDMNRIVVVTSGLAFTQAAANAIKEMEDAYKKDQALWQYYRPSAMTAKQIRELVDKIINMEG